jgi:hypothetical protein
MALCSTVAACTGNKIPLKVVIPVAQSVVTAARNRCAQAFLDSDATHLFFIDSDMDWKVESFLRILSQAQDKPLVRGAYPKRREPLVFDADGIGFCCVQRKVMEALAKRAPLVWYGEQAPCRAIFDERLAPTERAIAAGAEYEFISEDTGFFAKAAHLGYMTWLDPTIELGHVGEMIYRGALKDYMVMEENSHEGCPSGTEREAATKLVTPAKGGDSAVAGGSG